MNPRLTLRPSVGCFVIGAMILAPAIRLAAEDITVATYYPSPRGVYEQLQTTNTTNLATGGGNVGIGTTTPSAKLDIVGASEFNGQIQIVGNNLLVLGQSGNDPACIAGALYYNTTTNQFKGCNGATWSFLDSNWVLSGGNLYTGPAVTGNVGIGDTTPLALLTVGAGDLFRVDSTGRVNTIAGTAALPAFSFTRDTNTGIYSGGADILRFATAGADRVTIDATGRVGIGTTAPEAFTPLSIHASTPLHVLLQTNPGTNQGPHLDLNHAGQAGGRVYSIGSSGTGNRPGRAGVFEIYDGTALEDWLVIDGPAGGLVGIGTTVPKNRLDVVGAMAVGAGYAGVSVAPANGLIVAGNVGIGTSAPAQELEVGSPSGGNTHIKITANSANVSAVDFSDMAGAVSQGGVEYWHSCDAMEIYTVSGPELYLRGGNVGIGNYLACDVLTYKLQVAGSAANQTGVWSVLSDTRLKTDVQPITDALDKMTQLRGIIFKWIDPAKHGGETAPRMGLIAQEVEQVLPQWVHTNDDGYKDLTMTGFEALAIEAIKELRTEVTALKADNETLRKRVEALEHSR